MSIKRKYFGRFTRREFLKTGSIASLGIATGLTRLIPKSIAGVNETSRVVIVTDETVLAGSDIQQNVVRVMIDQGLMALTDTTSPADAWVSLIPDLANDLSVGIKVNTINSDLASHPDVAYPLANSLSEVQIGGVPFPENKITIWDRQDNELMAVGYAINDSSAGVKCFGTDHAGIGFHPDGFYAAGQFQRASRCYTDFSDVLINLSVLKNAGTCGVTFSLKNIFGGLSSPWELHDNACDPGIPAANAELFNQFGSRQKLCICDAIFGCTSGGPAGPPNLDYRGIVLSDDPVALDTVCRQILEDNGCTTGSLATYIATASRPDYNLGNSNPADIEVVEIINPTGIIDRGEALTPRQLSLGQNYPEPFNSGTTIPFSIKGAQFITLAVCDIRGRLIKTIHEGNLLKGDHRFAWDGTNEYGKPVASGRYIVSIKSRNSTISRTMTLIR